MKSVTILLIEANPDDRNLFKEYIQDVPLNSNVTLAKTLQEGIKQVEQQTPDILFLDLSLPDSIEGRGFRLIARKFPELPIIILTELDDVEVASKYIKLGAQDYLTKGEYDEKLLHKAIVYSLERKKMIQDKKEMEYQMLQAIVSMQEKERKRFAQDLHDSLGQLLAAVKMNITASTHSLSKKQQDAKKLLQTAIKLTDEAVIATRNISHGLMPPALIKHGVVGSINDMIEKINATNGIKIKFNSTIKEGRFKDEVEINVFRIIQEMINNSIKHSNASEIKIDLNKEGSRLDCFYQDNGVGLSKDFNTVSVGIGFKGIKTRVESLRGSFEVEDALGKGFVAKIQIPIHNG